MRGEIDQVGEHQDKNEDEDEGSEAMRQIGYWRANRRVSVAETFGADEIIRAIGPEATIVEYEQAARGMRDETTTTQSDHSGVSR